jgi:hypothetical protein
LKPDVGSPLTEVSERPTASAHLDSDLAGKEGACRCSYLVRMIKPNSIPSHDWHVQPICQRSVSAVRLSDAVLDRGPGCDAGVSSNLLRRRDYPMVISQESNEQRFCANLLNLSKLRLSVKQIFSPDQLPSPPGHSDSLIRREFPSEAGFPGDDSSKRSHRAKFERSTRQKIPSR